MPSDILCNRIAMLEVHIQGISLILRNCPDDWLVSLISHTGTAFMSIV